jgi:hypothetical protein
MKKTSKKQTKRLTKNEKRAIKHGAILSKDRKSIYGQVIYDGKKNIN